MARKASISKPTPQTDGLASRTLILDNGAHTIKAGFASAATSNEGAETSNEPNPDDDCQIIANCIARSQRDKRSYVGPELLDECWDFGELAFRRPMEKGFVVNWEGEKAIWERSFMDGRARLKV